MYKKRHLEELILKLSVLSPIILLTGSRQVGKTTLLEHLREKNRHAYVSLDEFEFRSSAKSDPALFLEKNPPPLIIDEIQYAPKLRYPSGDKISFDEAVAAFDNFQKIEKAIRKLL